MATAVGNSASDVTITDLSSAKVMMTATCVIEKSVAWIPGTQVPLSLSLHDGAVFDVFYSIVERNTPYKEWMDIQAVESLLSLDWVNGQICHFQLTRFSDFVSQ